MSKKDRLMIIEDGDKRFGRSGHTLAVARERLAEVGVTQQTPFRGYCVHLPATDEFLAKVANNSIGTARAFCVGPALAMRFPSYKAASSWVDSDKGEMIVGLFESESQYFVLSAEPESPMPF